MGITVKEAPKCECCGTELGSLKAFLPVDGMLQYVGYCIKCGDTMWSVPQPVVENP